MYAQKKIILTDNSDDYSIDTSSYILFDPGKKLTIHDVAFGDLIKKFMPIKKAGDNLGYRREAIWIRFTVKSIEAENENWILSLNYSTIDKAIFYSPAGNSIYVSQVAGLKYPMSLRKIKFRYIVFPFSIAKGDEKTFYLRLESGTSLHLNLNVYTPENFYKTEQNRVLLLGIFYGSLIIMALYNLFLFFSVKDMSYLYYSIYAFFVGYYQATVDGFAFQLFTPNLPGFNIVYPIVSAVSISLAGSFFAREFLKIKKYSPLLDRIFKIFITLVIVYICYVIIAKSNNSELTGPISAVYISLAIFAGIFCLRKGNGNAKYYLTAISIFVIGIFTRTFRLLGFINVSFLSEYGVQIGILSEMTLLSFALGNRINTIKQDEEKEKALIRSRIAGDLNEEIGEDLDTIITSGRQLTTNSKFGKVERKQLDDIVTTANETTDSISDIIWFINPEHDKTDDLILKMKNTASRLFREINFTFKVNDSKLIESKGLQFRRNLFLIYKEVLNNIVKHSNALNVKIMLSHIKGISEFKIEDDGIGFDLEKIKYGNGIKNIKKRAKYINVEVVINSFPGKGTSVIIPIRK